MQILVADNNDHTRSAVCQMLDEAGYRPIPAVDAAEALRIFRQDDIRMVVLDLVMVGMDGFELLKTLKQERPACEIIATTSFPSLDSVIKAMKFGASDYLVKTIDNFDTLIPTLNQASGKIDLAQQQAARIESLNREISRLKEINQNLNLGLKDQQTGLFDSSCFEDALASELNRSARHQRQFSIVLVRLNPEVEVGGTGFSIRALDSALPNWSQTIQERLRKSDIVARYDDHTLSIILPETGKDGALLVAECLIQLCDEVTQAVLGQEIEIAELIQVGIASYPDDGDSRDKLFDLANGHSIDSGSGTIH